jgi:hypothetical protein
MMVVALLLSVGVLLVLLLLLLVVADEEQDNGNITNTSNCNRKRDVRQGGIFTNMFVCCWMNGWRFQF